MCMGIHVFVYVHVILSVLVALQLFIHGLFLL